MAQDTIFQLSCDGCGGRLFAVQNESGDLATVVVNPRVAVICPDCAVVTAMPALATAMSAPVMPEPTA